MAVQRPRRLAPPVVADVCYATPDQQQYQHNHSPRDRPARAAIVVPAPATAARRLAPMMCLASIRLNGSLLLFII